MNTESVLILGGGIMQIPAIETAKKMGYKVFVADANKNAPGIKIADCFLHIDLKDKESLAQQAKKLKKNNNLSGVFTAGTDFSTSVAFASEFAGLPSISYPTAKIASNKALMRKVFTDAKLPSPSFAIIKNKKEAIEACAKINFPIVIKPVDSMGARGVIKIDSINDVNAIKNAVEVAIAASKSSAAIVEEFIDGPEFSLDAIIVNGEITICGFADRHIFFPPYFIEMGHTMPSSFNEKGKKEIIHVFKQGIKAIGIENGAAKGDMKYSLKKGPMIGEIAARLSGGFMSGWTFPYHSGINLTKAALKIACGKSPSNLKPLTNMVSAERAAISIPGKVKAIEGFENAKKVKYTKEGFLHTEKGQSVVFPVNNVQKCANFIAVAKKREIATKAAEEAVRKLFIRLVPGNIETSNFINRKTFKWVPDAFVLIIPENIAALIKMEESGFGFLPKIEEEPALDWHKNNLKDAFLTVQKLVKCTKKDFTPAFWKAFLRGGIQAGVWYIETNS